MKALTILLACLFFAPISWADCGNCDKKENCESCDKNHGGKGFFKKMDADKDGKVSKSEFVAAHNKKFDEMDTNKDGSITKDEKKAFRKAKKGKGKSKHKN